MLNNLLKMTALTLIWKKYRAGIVAVAVLIGYCWLVGVIHQDYLSYRALAGSDDTLGLSFVLKWLAWLAGFTVYLYYDNSPANKRPEHPTAQRADSISPATTDNVQRDEADPFAAIRNKKTLRSKADVVIDKHRA